MASLLASLLIKLGIDGAELKSGLSVAERDIQKATKRIEKIGNSMVNTGKQLSMAVTLPMLAIGGLAVEGALAQRAAIAQVETALTSMGNVAGRTSEQLAKNADALEMNSLVDADVILTKVTANLLTFGNVAGEVFDRAQQSAIDMAQRLGSDPQAAAVMLGKALNDPIKGITALTRVGVQFTAAQKAQIEAFVKTGEVAKAQGVILSEVERQFAGAAKAAAETSPWRQATVAINQTADAFGEALLPIIPPVTNAVIAVAQAFGSLSPGMQQTVLIAAAVAAAFGPVLVGVGQLTIVLASQLGPALAAFRASLVATAAAEGAAATASTTLAVAIRGLLIATGVGAAIAVLAGAVYLYTNRTREAVPASAAYSRSLATAQQTAKDAKAASERLAQAMGEERKAALAAASAQQQLAAQRLRAAQARLLQAETDARTTAAEAKRTAALASGGGPGEGVRGQISPSQQKFNAARRAAGTANADVKAAQASVIELSKAKADLERSIAAATNPVKLPAINAGVIDAGTKAAERAGNAVRGIGKAAQAAQDPVKELMDRLYPAKAEMREALKDVETLNKRFLDKAKLDPIDERLVEKPKEYSDAIAQLWRTFLGMPEGLPEQAIESLMGGETVEQMSARISDRFGDAMENLGKKAGATKVQVVKTMEDMVTDMMSAFDRLAGSIRDGDFLDILQAVVGVGIQLGNAGAFGKSVQSSLQKVPAYANGTDFHPGGLAIVGERGRELLNMPRGSQVKTNSELNAMMADSGRGQLTVKLEKDGSMSAFLEGIAGRVVDERSPALVRGASIAAVAKMGRLQQKSIG